MATGHLYTVLTASPAGRTGVAGAFARDAKTTMAAAAKPGHDGCESDDGWRREASARCHALLDGATGSEDDCCAGDDGDQSSDSDR